MKILEPLFLEAIETLLRNDVEFLLIGGYAVNFYGYGRYTGDIDFWLRPSDSNKEKFIKAFIELCHDESYVKIIGHLNFNQPQVISIGEPPLRVDFLTKVNLVDFDDAWGKRVFLELKDFQLPIVDYSNLVIMKFNTGRPKDQLDLEQLQRINQNRKK
ncbi:MAG: nucleotidyltransferase [Bacteroidia bacterium]|nr:nucleotidyltransferase [Bacteroidia bacterium]